MKRIRIEKLRASHEPAVPTPEWEEYIVGAVNPDVSLPTAYLVEGLLVDEISIGRPVRVLRMVRNGINVSGYFSTSPVIAYDENTIRTSNSVYRYTMISDSSDHLNGAF